MGEGQLASTESVNFPLISHGADEEQALAELCPQSFRKEESQLHNGVLASIPAP